MKLTKSQRIKINQIGEKHKLKLMILFGSQASRKNHKESDIDIAVLPLKHKDFEMKAYSSLLFDLEKVFAGGKIDITFIPTADCLILHNISRFGTLLFGSKSQFAEFKIYAFRRFQDYQPYFQLEEKKIHQFIEELKPA